MQCNTIVVRRCTAELYCTAELPRSEPRRSNECVMLDKPALFCAKFIALSLTYSRRQISRHHMPPPSSERTQLFRQKKKKRVSLGGKVCGSLVGGDVLDVSFFFFFNICGLVPSAFGFFWPLQFLFTLHTNRACSGRRRRTTRIGGSVRRVGRLVTSDPWLKDEKKEKKGKREMWVRRGCLAPPFWVKGCQEAVYPFPLSSAPYLVSS
ncbi:unnamed protein product [Discosporangium mesarthrocarpum]